MSVSFKQKLALIVLSIAIVGFQGPQAHAAQPAKPAAKKPERPKNPKMDQWMQNLARSGFPPALKGVAFQPPKPKAGQKIGVTASFAHNLTNATKEAKAGKHIVLRAWVSFSNDGGKRWSFPAMMKQVKPNTFAGTIPPQKKGAKVMVKLKAEDNHGNMYSEIACKVKGDPLTDPCMSDAAPDDKPVDDPSLSVPDSHDYVRIRVGQSVDKAYIVASVQGKVSPGTLSPMKVNAYIASFVEAQNPKNLMELFQRGNMVLYAPLAKAVTGAARQGGSGDVPMIAPCSIMNAKPNAEQAKKANDAFSQNTQDVTCKPSGSNLVLTTNIKALNPKFKQGFRFLGANFTITSLVPPNFDLKDWTRPTHFSVVTRVIGVQ